MTYLFPPQPVPALPVRGSSDLFPVRRIFCVARNYAAHAREMGADPDAEPPFFFCKPADALVPGGGTIAFPRATQDLHHEVELVACLGQDLLQADEDAARQAILGYTVGIDLTRRDLQAEAKAAGRPWDLAKGFDDSAPAGTIVTAAEIGHPDTGAIRLSVNGERRQNGDLSDLIWSVPQVLCHLSRFVKLKRGDLIFTGTPDGVSAVVPGDVLTAEIEGVGGLDLTLSGAD